MSFLVPLAAALLVSTSQVPLTTQLALPNGENAQLAADLVVYEADTKVVTARGNAVLRTETMQLRADEVTYDAANPFVTATGNVVYVGPGGLAAVADTVKMDVRTYEANLEGGLFMQKQGVTQEALFTAKTPQELRAMGETPLLMSGSRIRRTGENTFVVEDLAFTPCNCSPDEPGWRMEASSATIVLGERATMTLPVVYVKSVPVFALPWIYMPLSQRRTGLLIPKPTLSALNGFTLEQPLFITLGQSHDLTLTPGYFSGGTELHDVPGATEQVREPRYQGVKGPRLLTEFRYAPSERTRGRATLGFLYDLRPIRDPRYGTFFRRTVDGVATPEYVDERRGLRGEASWQHTQDMGGGWHNRVDAAFVSDGFYTRDLTADLVTQDFTYLRSTGAVFQRQDDLYAGLDVSLRQDIRWGYRFFQDNRVPAATDPARPELKGPTTFQRLPAITLALPERPVLGRLMGGLSVQYLRLAPLRGGYGDEGIDGLFRADGTYTPFGFDGWPPPADTTQSDGSFNSNDREARNRVDFFPRLSTSFGLGSLLRVSPSLGVRQDVWLGEVSGRTWQRGYPLAGLLLESQVARVFEGRETSFRHAITPSLELRYVPGGWGRLPSAGTSGEDVARPYDDLDAAVPFQRDGRTRGFLHAVLAVDQTLRFKRGTDIREPLRLRIGQGFDLTRHVPAAGKVEDPGPVLRDTFARLSATAGIFTAAGTVRYDPNMGRISGLSAEVNVDDGKGHAAYARFDDLLWSGQGAFARGADPRAVGPDVLRRSLDTLVGGLSRVEPGFPPAERAQALIAGTRLKLGFGLGVRYEAIVQPLYQDPITQENRPLAQQTFGLSYGPACDCWRVEGVVTLRRELGLEFSGVNFIVADFGSFGSGG
ncbi:LPS-assembly protein LptD [Corallococcus macrosporus]|uniref:Putative organic solvent tolerance protein n=1 Tax=Myxococcus fulvus (strain ATCC BAA-855 / HW-1) TaxID=483219 RepID=B8QZR7_MYXFH|nr:LPS assembly protein LptD [Corallococcus macrosporus]ACJ66673.1 putative organic solvent tolerance protein [Myxococcus fulvus HW-1]AEI66150.1 putative organic solvent tolerance protein [Corallococcus macrosporus]